MSAQPAHSDVHHDSHEGHVVDYGLYLQIWLGLLFLTCLTVVAATVNVGSLNIVIAMAIATVKATLVVGYFMHVSFDSLVVKGFLGVVGVTLLIIAALTIIDTIHR